MSLGVPPPGIEDIAEKVAAGLRLSIEEGLRLFEHPNLPELAALATTARTLLVPEKKVTYAAGIRMNWEALTASPQEAEAQVRQLAEAGGTELILDGAPPDDWTLDNALQTIRTAKGMSSGPSVIALSAIEIARLASQAEISVDRAMEDLKAAGLDRLAAWSFQYPPAEDEGPSSPAIVEPELRSPLLASLQAAQDAEIPVTCRIRLSQARTLAERMDQLMYARELQEKSGAFLTVTPLNVEASGEAAGTAFDYLRAVAITRIMLDNVTHVRSSYETQGLKVAQMALKYGADDFGLITLSKGSEGGMHFAIPIPELERNIREAGFTPVCRSARYEPRPTPQLPVPAAPISLQLPK